ncbi:hypothetical protein SS50377_22693 [Spironucleus salmonicida]|uniref:Uncharacterized protein n=1 Tax=Spironucleus salmonicida TaxID=348837 RepID=A0A9P8RZJ9_9EUKA|nr:hypothetical protein SS50377_22693 [Spironucleus salmonicida]
MEIKPILNQVPRFTSTLLAIITQQQENYTKSLERKLAETTRQLAEVKQQYIKDLNKIKQYYEQQSQDLIVNQQTTKASDKYPWRNQIFEPNMLLLPQVKSSDDFDKETKDDFDSSQDDDKIYNLHQALNASLTTLPESYEDDFD